MLITRNITSLIILPMIMFSFSQCSSQKKLQETAPVKLSKAYCQTWVAGARGGGSGINIFIPVETAPDKKIVLDSVYFRGRSAKLETKPQNDTLYIGRFLTKVNEKYDLVMSSDPKQEYGNKRPEDTEKIPFELKMNECVVSYTEGKKTKYFKIDEVEEKAAIPPPMARKQ
ncbi:MAG: hypothetical protein KJP09_05200 [Bacteroidia bacterium]|nr:hypothetical protein [Bacteroidia bacterium]NND10405.1 hypothetical protein [Flavobacteriaceae bacterium]NNK27821.1 hypothetical protein [Flavobacteriaceae bacterium]